MGLPWATYRSVRHQCYVPGAFFYTPTPDQTKVGEFANTLSPLTWEPPSPLNFNRKHMVGASKCRKRGWISLMSENTNKPLAISTAITLCLNISGPREVYFFWSLFKCDAISRRYLFYCRNMDRTELNQAVSGRGTGGFKSSAEADGV